VGRTGRVTPFAVLEPVVVAGSTVSMATLHNQDQVKAKDVRPGDLVIVRKAGDVIPEVVSAVIEAGRRRKPPWKFPTTCRTAAACSNASAKRATRTASIRPVRATAPTDRALRFSGALDIEGLGEQRVAQLLNVGLISGRRRPLLAARARPRRLEGLGELSATSLVGRSTAPSRCP